MNDNTLSKHSSIQITNSLPALLTLQTTICRRLLRAPQAVLHIPTEQLSTVVAPVKPRTQKSEEKMVIMTEIPSGSEDHAITDCIQFCDIACRQILHNQMIKIF